MIAFMRTRPHGVREDHWSRRCPGCAYDLSGLLDRCKCPECGKDINEDMRSVAVWWLQAPNFSEFVIMLILALMSCWVLIGVAITQPEPLSLLAISFFAFGFTVGAIIAYKKLQRKSVGETDAWLHFTPHLVCLWCGGRVLWNPWDDVRQIRIKRSLLSRYWTISVFGRRRWYVLGMRPSLITAVARLNRREAALIRNTMKRYWKPADGKCPTRDGYRRGGFRFAQHHPTSSPPRSPCAPW
jgi:hypothetical protein